VRSVEEVLEEGRRLLGLPGCDGLLVAEMVRGDREFVYGLTRDPQFGPCVMFGLGGVLTQALADAVFRVAPLTRLDALEMLGQIRALRERFGPDQAIGSLAISVRPHYSVVRSISAGRRTEASRRSTKR
jgi:ATP-grasp domain